MDVGACVAKPSVSDPPLSIGLCTGTRAPQLPPESNSIVPQRWSASIAPELRASSGFTPSLHETAPKPCYGGRAGHQHRCPAQPWASPVAAACTRNGVRLGRRVFAWILTTGERATASTPEREFAARGPTNTRGWSGRTSALTAPSPQEFNAVNEHGPHSPSTTGELFNFGIDFRPRIAAKLPLGLNCYRVDWAGRLHKDATVPLDHAHIQHDFALTEHYYVFVLAPIILDPVKAMLGLSTAEAATSYRPEVGTKIILVPRGGGKRREIECPPLMYVHINNAFEDRGDVVVDLVRYDDYHDFFDPARDFRTPAVIGGYASRLRVSKGSKVTVKDFSGQRTELPQHDWRRTSRTYRYGYHGTLDSRLDASNRVVKIDTDTGRHLEHVFEPGDAVGEPIFVPRSATAAEDDGWLQTVVYLAAEHRSALVVLDARDPSRAPIAVARLDRHFFPGFHGSFASRVTAS